MNKVILIGRPTKDPDVKYTQDQLAIAKFTLAVDRRGKEKATDFISCVAFGKTAEFVEKYITKGTRIALEGQIRTGSYNKQSGEKVYTTDVVVEQVEFAQTKAESAADQGIGPADGFLPISDKVEGLPFGE